MIVPAPLCRLPYRLLRRIATHGVSRIGARRIITPLHDPAALAWIYWQPTWKGRLIQRILSRRAGAFLDVGVNFGQTLADCLAHGVEAPYFGFEPNPRCLAYLADLLRANTLPPVNLLPCALAAANGPAALYFNDTDPMAATATTRRDLRPGNRIRREWMMAARLDDLAAPLGLDAIGLIKIDVEGAELEALQGMSGLLRTHRPPVICEVLLADAAADLAAFAARMTALLEMLQAVRYGVRRIRQDAAGNLLGFERLNEFPVAHWTRDTGNDCDYLFESLETTESVID